MRSRQFIRAGNLPLAVTYLLVIVLSVVMFVQARGFPASSMGPASPGFFPQVVSVLLILLSVAGLIELRIETQPAVRVSGRVVQSILAAFVYVGVMHLVGYYPSTFLFAAFIMWLVRGQASVFRLMIDSALLVAASFVFFDMVVGAVLPRGILFD